MKTFIKGIIVIMLCLTAGCARKEGGQTQPAQNRSQLPAGQEPQNTGDKPPAEEALSPLKYGREDPFSPVFDKIDRSKQKTLMVEGIVWDKQRAMVIINNQIIGVGDQVEGNTVVEIKDNSVILNDGIKDFELRLGQEK